MKILQVIHSVNPQAGGTTEGLRQLSSALMRQGVEVDVLCLDAPDAVWLKSFPLRTFALGPGRGGYGYSKLVVPWLVSHAAEYDLVVVNGLWQFGSYAVWLAAQKAELAYVVFPHGMLDPWFKRHYPLKHLKKWLYWPWGEYRVLRDAAAVLFTTEAERIEARKSFWLYRCREQVVGFGIDAPPEEATLLPKLFLTRYAELEGKRLLLFLGRMHIKKGCDLLLRAFHDLVAAGSPQYAGLHLVMAGPYDSPFGAEMRALSEELKLGERVTWTGMLSGDLKWSALYAANAFILPSHQENFGVSVVEALACGCPVLISDQVNIWREIEAAGAGVVAHDDPAGTQTLLQQWASADEFNRPAKSMAAVQCYRSHFTMTEAAEKFVSLTKDLKKA